MEPSAPIADLSKAKIALCTTGGMVPMGNPDHMVAATAKFWKEYPVEGDKLERAASGSPSTPASTPCTPTTTPIGSPPMIC